MIVTTPRKPTPTATSRRPVTRSPGRIAMVASTVAIGVAALPMPASAELILVSDSAKRVNGSAPRKNPQTNRWPHTRRPVGRWPPRASSSTLSTAAPRQDAQRPRSAPADIDSSPTFISRKLEPQISTSATYFTCQGTRGSASRRHLLAESARGVERRPENASGPPAV